jgi:hypothetical protein
MLLPWPFEEWCLLFFLPWNGQTTQKICISLSTCTQLDYG